MVNFVSTLIVLPCGDMLQRETNTD
jgi:hypothetical protein